MPGVVQRKAAHAYNALAHGAIKLKVFKMLRTLGGGQRGYENGVLRYTDEIVQSQSLGSSMERVTIGAHWAPIGAKGILAVQAGQFRHFPVALFTVVLAKGHSTAEGRARHRSFTSRSTSLQWNIKASDAFAYCLP